MLLPGSRLPYKASNDPQILKNSIGFYCIELVYEGTQVDLGTKTMCTRLVRLHACDQGAFGPHKHSDKAIMLVFEATIVLLFIYVLRLKPLDFPS